MAPSRKAVQQRNHTQDLRTKEVGVGYLVKSPSKTPNARGRRGEEVEMANPPALPRGRGEHGIGTPGTDEKSTEEHLASDIALGLVA